MPTISINNQLNKIYTEKNLLNSNSNLKKLFKNYDKVLEENTRQLELLIDNFNFCYSEEDFVSIINNTEDNKKKLINLKYLETDFEKYQNEEYNVVYQYKNIDKKANNIIKEKIKYFDGAKNIELDYVFENNILVLYNQNNIYFEYEYEEKIIIKDFIFMNNKIYLFLNFEEKDWIVMSSLSHEFAKINQITTFEEIECFYKIDLKYEFDFLINIENNNYSFINKFNKQIFQVILGKKYFFEYENDLYFTDSDNTVLNNIKKNTLQLEFLFLYDLSHLCGLSDFIDENENKIINTKIIKNKEDLFKLKIDNTKNGLINYIKIKENKINFYKSKNFNINGNFYLKTINEKSNYKIIIKNKINNNLNFFELSLYENDNLIKKINISTYSNYIYFCNLKIEKIFNIDSIEEIELLNENILNIKNINYIFNDEFYNNKGSYEQEIYNNRILNYNNKILSNFKIDKDKISNINLKIENKIFSFDNLILNFNNPSNINQISAKNTKNNFINFEIKEKEIKLNKIIKEKELIKIKKNEFNLNIKGE